jgi:hypothetical protein
VIGFAGVQQQGAAQAELATAAPNMRRVPASANHPVYLASAEPALGFHLSDGLQLGAGYHRHVGDSERMPCRASKNGE